MPRFNPIESVTAGMLVLDAGDYEFQIGEPKPFYSKKEDPNTGKDISNYGVRYNLTIKSGPGNIGETVLVNLFLHSEGAAKMAKQFIMAALGFNVNQTSEAEYNAKYGQDSWFDTDDNSIGPVFAQLAGRMIRGNASIKANPMREGEMQNNFRWTPFQA